MKITTQTIQRIKELADGGLTIREIASQVSLGKSSVQRVLATASVSVTPRAIHREIAQPKRSKAVKTESQDTPQVGVLKIAVKEDNGDIVLYIKTSEEFEQWMKEHKEVRTTTNLFGNGGRGQFYYLRFLDENTARDDINSQIFYNNKLNVAILRVVGISQGLTFNLGRCALIQESKLMSAIKDFTKKYSDFYNSDILQKKLNISGEVVIC